MEVREGTRIFCGDCFWDYKHSTKRDVHILFAAVVDLWKRAFYSWFCTI